MRDLIDRQVAIDGADLVIARDTSGNNDVVEAMKAWKMWIKGLPAAQTVTDSHDLISRQEAIEAVKKSMYNNPHKSEIQRGMHDHEHRHFLTILMGLPSAQPEQRWIPVTERLPDEYGEYRITWATSASKKRFVGDSEYEITSEWDDEHHRFKGEWLLDDYIKNYPDVKVIAWKPIEEPYREGEQHG